MVTAKQLGIFVIMWGDRGYYSSRAGGSAFRSEPEDFSIFRNAGNAQKTIRKEIRNIKGRIELAKERGYPTANDEQRLLEWEQAEVVPIVN